MNVDDLKNGMILSTDLKDSNGRFLFRRGAVLEEKHVRIMKIWGITSVNVEGVTREDVEHDLLAAVDPGILQNARSYVTSIFVNSEHIPEHDALIELKQLCLLRAVKNLSKGIDPAGIKGQDKNEKEPPVTYAEIGNENKLSLHDLVGKNVQLSSFPDIYHQIVDLLNDTRASAVRLADVVSKDPGLSATILKLVNSAFYGLPTRVDSIARAIALIGGKELSALAMGISVIRYFKGIPPKLVNMKEFWMHSIACGVFARILANRKVDFSEEQYFIGGLLHDIGRLILYKELPKNSAKAIRLSLEKGKPLYQMEQDVLGYDHTEVAGLLLANWNFSKSLVQMIRYHHTPLASKSPVEPSFIMVSDILAKVLRFGGSGDTIIPPFEKEVWDVLGLSPSVLSHSVKQADRQVNEILRVFHMNE